MIGKKILGILIAFLVAVSFAPITGQVAFADELPDAFNAAGHVTGLSVASAEYKSVTIKWSEYKGAEGYEVYRATKKKGKKKYKKIATVKGCTLKDKGNKKLGKKKYYKVRAYGMVGSVKRYTSFSSVLAAKSKLGQTKGLTTSPGSGRVVLKWNKVAGAAKYQVYRATSKNGKYTRLGTTKKRQYTNTSLTVGTKYFYKVRAYKKKHGKNYGTFSVPVEGVSRPGMTGGFRVALGENGTVTASWSKVNGAAGYELQRTASGGTYVTVGETSNLSMTDTLTQSGQYTYRIRAFVTLNGKRVYGDYSAGGRDSAVAQARSWVGCRESNGSHKKIIDVYNGFNPKYGKISYGASWCAAFVSAVAIKTGNTAVIPVDCYCPRMMNNFANKTSNKSYTPKSGDVVFYDWNYNKVPDHVGMIDSVSGSDVTTIEGNYSDAVKKRTYKKGYSLLLKYGLPEYIVNNKVSYTAPAAEPEVSAAAAASVSEEDVQQACDAVTAPELSEEQEILPAEEPTVEPKAIPEEESVMDEAEEVSADETEAFATEPEVAAEETAEPATDAEAAEMIIEYIQEEEPAADEPVEESTYNAFLVYEVCDEMDIDACVVTVTDGDGAERSYNEVVLDGKLYVLDATSDGGVLQKYTPEEIN